MYYFCIDYVLSHTASGQTTFPRQDDDVSHLLSVQHAKCTAESLTALTSDVYYIGSLPLYLHGRSFKLRAPPPLPPSPSPNPTATLCTS